MAEPSLLESAWVRGWSDTKLGLGTWQFWALEVFGGGLTAIFANPAAALIFVLGMVAVMWICATVIAPIRQRNELREFAQSLKGEPLDIRFESGNPACVEIIGNGIMYRLAVRNRQNDKSVDRTTLEVMPFDGSEGSILPANASLWRGQEDNINIGPKQTQYFNFIEFAHKTAELRLHNQNVAVTVAEGIREIIVKASGSTGAGMMKFNVNVTEDGVEITPDGSR